MLPGQISSAKWSALLTAAFFQGLGGRNEVSGAEFLQHIREARDSECKAPCAKKGWGRP
jgi:hypothetical protein